MTTTTTSPAPLIEDLFHQGHPLDHVLAVGLEVGWDRDDVMVVLRDRQWDLDASGRLPRSKRVTTPRGLRNLPSESMRAPVAPTPGEVDDVIDDVEASAGPGFADAMLLQEAAASVALDGETQVIGGDTAAEPRPKSESSSYIAVLKASELGVDHSYQRPLDEARVRRMVKDWNPRMVGVLEVSDRGDGELPRYAVVNGQHRAAAAARVSPAGGDVPLACTVHEGLTVADEAALMHELDRKTKKLSGFDQWRARRAAGDPIVADVEAVVRTHGLRIAAEPADGVMRSYGSAEKLVKLGGRNLLDNTLGVLRAAYGAAASAYQAPLLMGVGQLIHRSGDALDAPRLHRALAATRPEQLRSTATTLREIDGGPLHELMSRAIAGAYNRTPGSGPRIAGDR